MRERPCRLEARNVRNCRVRSDVEENLVARQHARPAVIQTHLERLRRHKTTRPHDQFGAARPVVLQVIGNQAVNHVALAPAKRRPTNQYWATPPSTINSTPVTYALSSEARNTAALAISSGVPMRSRGIFVTRSACALSSSRTSRPGVEM